jgi:hypothetical protein
VAPPTQMPDQANPHNSRPARNGQNPRVAAYTAVESAPTNSAGTNSRRRGQRSYASPAGPLRKTRTTRLALRMMPTLPSVIPASAVCVGNTAYSVVSPTRERAVPRPRGKRTLAGWMGDLDWLIGSGLANWVGGMCAAWCVLRVSRATRSVYTTPGSLPSSDFRQKSRYLLLSFSGI